MLDRGASACEAPVTDLCSVFDRLAADGFGHVDKEARAALLDRETVSDQRELRPRVTGERGVGRVEYATGGVWTDCRSVGELEEGRRGGIKRDEDLH